MLGAVIAAGVRAEHHPPAQLPVHHLQLHEPGHQLESHSVPGPAACIYYLLVSCISIDSIYTLSTGPARLLVEEDCVAPRCPEPELHGEAAVGAAIDIVVYLKYLQLCVCTWS